MHSCGSVRPLMPDFIEAGFDILNPVQCSAADMDPGDLKREFGERLTFWGGGVDTQKTLPFGTPDEVRAEVRQRIGAFGPAAASSSTPSTTSRHACRSTTSWPCSSLPGLSLKVRHRHLTSEREA